MLITILSLLCAVLLLLVFCLLPGESTPQQREPFWRANLAHRGLHRKDHSLPENSMAAFTAAADAGYGIELDLRLSADGEVVVFHDDDLQRMCGTSGLVAQTPLAQLQKLPLLGGEQRIPTLREVLAMVNGRVPLVLELKHGGQNKTLCENTWRLLRLYDGDICVESFDPRILRWFYKHVPGLLRGQLSAPPRSLRQGLKGYAVGWLFSNFLCRPQFIAYQKGPRSPLVWLASRLAMRVVWTARPGDDLEELAYDNDAIIFEFYEPEPYWGLRVEDD